MTNRALDVNAPLSWRNWDTPREVSVGRFVEIAMYTDAHPTGENVEAGPYSALITFSNFFGHAPQLGIVLRMAYGVALDDPHGLNADDLGSKTRDKAYHGGDIYDELAALLSLALGIRCQSGGEIRRWDIASDPLGRHFEWHHAKPYLPPPSMQGSVLPHAAGDVNLAEAQPYLAAYRALTARKATAVVRAARLYQQALWISDSDPSMAWILLVSAIEVAAENRSNIPALNIERLRLSWPEMGAVLESVDPKQRDAIADLLGPTVKVGAKFLQFLAEFMPGPPEIRPSEYGKVDWVRMHDHLVLVYRYRSLALHAGKPFPYPMCQPPHVLEEGVPLEVPLGLSSQIGGSAWLARDTPMLLHVFEYLTRVALQKWWLA
ncbi:hypothetical protein GCM10010435_41280 [Winogradskya consettensis]|uniref:Uncharacterized protein n=1 Tax=Winogradskya consettensis TaxID=113560 RepID=A0A919W1V9_9ACTN|nr:hypothetical protein [Actinoplanes consettensis]GIM76873.1 hypothetical protein Aco04nite_52600 [Actinoplanes consettensis]